MMFQDSSSDGSTGPRALSTNAMSAAEGSSPYSASGLSPPPLSAAVVVVSPPPAAVVAGASVVGAAAAVVAGASSDVVVVSSAVPHAAATRASTASTQISFSDFMSSSIPASLPWVRCSFEFRHSASISFPTGQGMSGRLLFRSTRSSSETEHTLHRLDDPVPRNQHSPDDHEAEHHELEILRHTESQQHLIEAGEKDRGDEGGQRAGEPTGQRRSSDDHRRDRTEKILIGGGHPRSPKEPRVGHPRRRVQNRGRHVDEDAVEVHANTDHMGGDGVGPHDLETSPDGCVAERQHEPQSQQGSDPEDGADAEDAGERPVGPGRGHRALDREAATIPVDDADHDLAHGESHDQGVELETADE